MFKNIKNNESLTKEFNKYYPGGHSNFRASMKLSLETAPYRIFADRAEGSRIWDIDGNEYVDFSCAMGPIIIGHRHPQYQEALMRFLEERSPVLGSGYLFSSDDIKVAEKLIKHVPCAEAIKFNMTGTEAVQTAIRLARGFTQKKYVIRFDGHYHGWADNVLGGQLRNEEGVPHPYYNPNATIEEDASFTNGRSKWAERETLLLPYNDIEAFENCVEKYHDEIAMVHMEGIVGNHFCMLPLPGYLERIRELCTQYNIVFSMDEVITGFRVGLGGAQEYLGVTPDLATFGKAIAGGMPISAIMGKKEIMQQLGDGRVLGPGTFNGYALGVRAVLATLEILEKDNGIAYKKMADIQKKLESGLMKLADKHGIKAYIQSIPGCFYFLVGIDRDKPLYTDADMKGWDQDKQLELRKLMQDEGILHLRNGRFYMNTAHTDEDVEMVLEVADKVFPKL